MAFDVGSRVEVAVKYILSAQTMYNVFQYKVSTIVGGGTANDYATGWWNEVKGVYRGLAAVGLGPVFQSVTIKDLDTPTGAYAEFGIPEAEQTGTRANPSPLDQLPPFNAAGIRFLVGSRVTRPGQKRLAFMFEPDQNNGTITAPFQALLVIWADKMTNPISITFGTGSAILDPIITRKNSSGLVLADQPVEGYLINPFVTSQTSRKVGRGQ